MATELERQLALAEDKENLKRAIIFRDTFEKPDCFECFFEFECGVLRDEGGPSLCQGTLNAIEYLEKKIKRHE